MSVEKDARGLRVLNVFDGSPAAARRHPRAGPDPVGQRPLDRGPEQRPGHRPHQGPGRHLGRSSRCSRRARPTRAACASSASASHVPVATGSVVERNGHKLGVVQLTTLQLRRPRRAAPPGRQAARRGRRGDRARPARQRRRPADRGRARVEHLHRGRQDRLRPRPRAAEAHRERRGRRDRPEHPGGRARRRRQRQRLGDRHRRAARPPPRDGGRHEHVRQGRSSRRSSRSPTVAYLDLTVANYYLPGGKTISTKRPEAAGARGRQAAHHARRGAPRGARTCWSPSCERRNPGPAGPAARPTARRGARAARPLPGRRAAVRRRSAHGGRARRGGRGRPGAGRLGQARRARRAPARAAGRRPRRARGPDARPRPAPHLRSRRDGRGGGRGGRPLRRRRPRRPHRAAHLHDRPRRRQGLRRRDLGSPRGRLRPALGPHRRRDRLRAPGRAARARGAAAARTSVYVPGAVEPMLPEVLSNRRLLAAAGRGRSSP